MGRLKKYYFRNPLKNIPKENSDKYLQRQVFGTSEFDLHVKRVAFNLNIDEVIVRDVLVSYFSNIMYLINTVRKIKTKINVYCYFSLIVEKGNRY
jgi:hypothetical protein